MRNDRGSGATEKEENEMKYSNGMYTFCSYEMNACFSPTVSEVMQHP